MSSDLSLFPVLTSELVEKIGFSSYEPVFSYHDECGNESVLKSELIDASGCYKLDGSWSFDEYDLMVKKRVQIGNVNHFFGKNGVACQDAELGIAMEWMSPSSRQRGTSIAMDSIKYSYSSSNSVDLEINLNFKKAFLRGQVAFRIILFLRKSGHPSLHEMYLANQEGFSLGVLEEFELILDGSGSEFPIFVVNEPNNPLWRVKCEWDDPSVDQFNDCVSIYLNEANPSYKYLDEKSKSYDAHLMVEVVAHAMTVIVAKLKDNPDHWQTVENIGVSQTGSVSRAINYILSLDDIDKTNMEAMSFSIRKFLEKGLSRVV